MSKSLTNGLICLIAGVAAVFIALKFGAIGMCGGSMPLLVLLCLGLAAFLAGVLLMLFWAVRGLYRKLTRPTKDPVLLRRFASTPKLSASIPNRNKLVN